MAWYHLLLDLYGCDVRNLNDESLLQEAFRDLSKILDMHVIAGPLIVRYVGKKDSPSGEGLSGFMIVAESHVSIHTDIRTGYASIDVYSCKEFDADQVEEYLRGIFKPKKLEKRFILRGPAAEAWTRTQAPE
ncbi:MAG: S-adenosylmethionine decarboxylase [Thaumarchaeota archaeon]|nr:S-adenosylmethionine decarboxylase [Nitrososphaerota archaeon]